MAGSLPSHLQALQQRLQGHLEALVGDRDPYLASGRHQFAQNYIQMYLSQWGEVTAWPFTVRGRIHQNWLLKLPAHLPRAECQPPILVGAHYDTVPGTPGADDNASGVAVLLELARYAAQNPPLRSLWLVAFDLEEYGLQGSHALATALKATEQPLRLMLSLEMLGYCDRRPHSQRYPHPALKVLYPHRADFIALIGSLSTLPDLMHLKRHMRRAGVPGEWLPVPRQGKIIPDSRRSDHAPFWDAGYRAVMVTDTSFLRNPHYHQGSDRLDTLDLDFMTQVCQGLMTAVTTLG